MRRILCCSIAFFAICAGRTDAQVCLCSDEHSVLTGFLEAEVVVVCRVKNAVPPDNAHPSGQWELTVEDMLVPHALVQRKHSIVVPTYRAKTKEKHLVAMDVYKGNLDPYMSVLLDEKGEMERFVRGALRLKDKSPLGRARYSVDFCVSPNPEVVQSAFSEVRRLGYADFRKLAETLKPDSWLKSLQDGKMPISYLSTSALLLGHCGNKEHAVVLRKLLDDRERAASPSLLIAYVLLDPENGWKYACDTLDEKDSPLLRRYAAMKTV